LTINLFLKKVTYGFLLVFYSKFIRAVNQKFYGNETDGHKAHKSRSGYCCKE